MTTRTDITFDLTVSPRIIEVQSPSTVLTVQDLVDTVRDFEDELGTMSHPSLIAAAGKENLGGGVQVGITATLLNAKVGFESRTTPAESGTATASDPVILTDTSATFLSNNVIRGALVINFTDLSVGDVISVEDENNLTVRFLTGGTTNTFTSGDTYRVYNEVQCNLLGGNIVAVDDMDLNLDPVQVTSFTQVVRTSSSSATLLGMEQLFVRFEEAAYGDKVHIDVVNGVPGTDIPIGQSSLPSNNTADAVTIARNLGISDLIYVGAPSLTLAEDVDELVLRSGGGIATFTGQAGNSLDDAMFDRVILKGNLEAGPWIASNCVVGADATTTTLGDAGIENSQTCGTIQLTASTTKPVTMEDVILGHDGITTLDVNGQAYGFRVYNATGEVTIANATNAGATVWLDLRAGRTTIAASCTNGLIVVTGDGALTNLGTSTVVDYRGNQLSKPRID